MASGTDKRQRSATVTVRLTPDERLRLENLSSRSGLAVGAFMRAAALGETGARARRLPPADHVALRRVLADLGRIGNNLNQLARGMNTGTAPDVPELRDAAHGLLAARDAIFAALGKEPVGDYQGQEQGSP